MEYLKTVRRFRYEIALCALAVFSVAHMATAQAARLAQEESQDRVVVLQIQAMHNQMRPYGGFPSSGRRWTIRIPITAYSSEPWQTDDTPFITASGTHVRDGIVAANFLPIGTRVRIPEIYGKKEFVVEDRMNARYYHKMDIWMAETPEARRFGVKYAEVEVLPN